MYYLYNIPAGDFTLEVWVSEQNPLLKQISVGAQAYTDIQPIQVP